MSKRTQAQTQATSDSCFIPTLEAAIQDFDAARHRFQTQSCKTHLNAYMKCCDELGQGISQLAIEKPELALQFGLWFDSHLELWAPPAL